MKSILQFKGNYRITRYFSSQRHQNVMKRSQKKILWQNHNTRKLWSCISANDAENAESI